MHTSTITSKGQITIPAECRRIFNFTAGKKVKFIPDQKQQRLIVKPLYPFKSVSELPACGMWENRKDMVDTNVYIKKMRDDIWGRAYKKNGGSNRHEHLN